MKEFISKNFFYFWFALFTIATLVIWFLPWRFQVNDDQVMMWLVSGAYTGTPESYAVFIHPFLSWSFSKFYTLSPTIPWYPLTWFMVVYCSFLSLIKVLSKKKIPFFQQQFLAMLICLVCVHFLYFLQFTQVAGIAFLAGLILFISSSGKSILYLISITLMALGLLIRYEAVILVSIGTGIFFLIVYKYSELKKIAFRLLPVFGITLLLISSKYYWEKESAYSKYLQFNKARSGVLDHPVFHRLLIENEISENSKWFFLSRWFFEEGEIMTQDLIQYRSSLNQMLFSVDQVAETFRRTAKIQMAEAFKSFISLLILGLVVLSNKKKEVIFMVIWLLLLLILSHFFIFYGRVTILFFLVLLIPLILNCSFFGKENYWKWGISFLVLALFFHSINFLKEGYGRKIMRSEITELTVNTSASEPIFIEGYQVHMFGLNYNQFNPSPFIIQGWISRSPFQEKALRRFIVSKISELETFSLLAIQMDEPLVFPEYMKSLNPNIHRVSFTTSPNFQFLQFKSDPD